MSELRLGALLNKTEVVSGLDEATAKLVVSGLQYDNRKIAAGEVFWAFSGAVTDGRKFAKAAVERGAIAVVSELEPLEAVTVPWIRVAHGRQSLALAAGAFYGHPDEQIAITGVTGTNGKTTTTWILDSILRASGRTTALVGTVGYHVAGEQRTAVNTTPESLDLFRILAELRGKDGTNATMEVSSHALALGRVHGVHFHTAVFTNLTRDHLDFHLSMEEYFAAKRMLFDGPPAPRFAVINADDEYGKQLQAKSVGEVIRYGIRGGDFRAEAIDSSFQGLRFDVRFGDEKHSVESPLVGEINVYNLLGAMGAARTLNVGWEAILEGIRHSSGVPGRFERVEAGQPFLVVVDYAHTDDALRNTIRVARKLLASSGKKGRVLTLFGCGGDRDRAKRPLMGMAAGEFSDFVALTSDNPRSEDPLAIMNDALVGLRRFDTTHIVEPDRAKAITKILSEAEPGDIVILAGKGHETYQVLKDETISFDDREVARKALIGFGYGSGKKGAG